MPPAGSGFQSALQAWQIAKQDNATAAQFSEAIMRLNMAERQFQQRMQFEREVFALDKQKYESQLSYKDAQEQMLKAQLEQLQTAQKQQAAATEAYTAFQQKSYGPYLSALAAGKDDEAKIASAQLDLAFAQLPPLAQRQFLEAEEGRLKLEMYPVTMAAKIQDTLSKQREGAGLLGGAESLENLTKIKQGLTDQAAGFNWAARLDAYKTDREGIDVLAQRLGGQLNALIQKHQLSGNQNLAAAITAGLLKNPALVQQGINQSKSDADDTAKADLETFERAYAQLLQQSIVQRHNLAVDRQKHDFAQQLVETLHASLASVSGMKEASGLVATEMSAKVKQVGDYFDALRTTEEFTSFMATPEMDQTKNEAVFNWLKANVPEEDLRVWLERSVMRFKALGLFYRPESPLTLDTLFAPAAPSAGVQTTTKGL